MASREGFEIVDGKPQRFRFETGPDGVETKTPIDAQGREVFLGETHRETGGTGKFDRRKRKFDTKKTATAEFTAFLERTGESEKDYFGRLQAESEKEVLPTGRQETALRLFRPGSQRFAARVAAARGTAQLRAPLL
jgi:hypothetical protein